MKNSKCKKIIKIILTTVFISLTITFFVTGYQVTEGVYNLVSREDTLKYYEEKYKSEYEKFANKYRPKNLTIKSSKFGHEIPALYIDNKYDKGIVIMSHGLGALKEEMYFEGELFLDLGYDLLLYDQRNSGENFAPLNTFGYYEAYDLKDIFLYADKVNNRKKILWGQSMGAMAIAISIGKFDIKPDFLIFDSPVINGKEMIYKEFDNIEKDTGIPKYLMVISGNLISKFRYDFDFSDLTANKYLKTTDIPLLILTAKNDDITSFESQRDFFNSLKIINKKMIIFEKAKHANLYADDPAFYKTSVENFLK